MTTPEPTELTELTERVEAARRKAMWVAPYAAEAFAYARLVITDDPSLPFAACDTSWRVYFAKDVAARWPIPQLAWLWLHEVLGHLVQRHGELTRNMGLEPRRANIAQDLAIESWEWDDPNVERPTCGIHPAYAEFNLPVGLHWLDYYDRLPDQPSSEQEVNCGSGANGSAQPWELPDDGQGPSDVESRAIASKIAEGIKRAGSSPAGLRVWADETLRPPRPDWRRRLRAQVSALRSGYEDQQGAARIRRGMVYRRWTEPHLRACIVADTSGSMYGHGSEVLSVVRDTVHILGECDVCWTDTVPVWQSLRRGSKVEAVGGGGTDLRPAIEEAFKRKYSIVVIVTDCETPWPSPRKEALVLSVGNGAPPAGWRHIRECK